MKKMFIILVIVFISGLLSADICLEMIKDSKALLNIETYTGYAYAKLAYRDVFWNIIYERIKLFVFMILLYFTPIRNVLKSMVLFVFSYMWGFYIMSCIMELGLAGVVVGIFSVVPHGILYGILIMMILANGEVSTYSYYQKRQLVLNAANVIIMILLLLTGCVLEGLVSTHFIPWVIRLSLI